MFRVNANYAELSGGYLFSEISRRVAVWKSGHPDGDLIRLGIGDVTLPLAEPVVTALRTAADEMGRPETFRGYGPEQGYGFLISAIIEHDYRARGVELDPDEVFVSDGSKCDVANIQELFAADSTVLIGDPVYPVYRDSNLMAGRGAFLRYLPFTAGNGFSPEPPEEPADLIYLCSPNNPTGTVLSRAALTRWVEYAREHGSVILFDAAYEAYIRDPELPHSIYEIPEAKEVAIEFRSFSKTAGFTGVRCAWCVVPRELPGGLNRMWQRRQTTKFNGVSYVVQRAARAVYSEAGRRAVAAQVSYYMDNAEIIRRGLSEAGFTVYGGVHAPYIWWKLPEGVESMPFFDRLLECCQVVGTPGIGFGHCGEGCFRLTAFGDRERTREAVGRIVERLRW